MKSKKTPLEKFQIEMLWFAKSASRLIAFMLFLASFDAFNNVHAQVIWGITSGGELGTGSIFKANDVGTDFTRIRFEGAGNNNIGSLNNFSRSKLLRHSNGKMYGITLGGGDENDGVLFEFDPSTGKSKTKLIFSYYDNGRPGSSLIEYKGKVYVTIDGLGPGIASFDPVTNTYKREVTIPLPATGMVLAEGKFYCMTRSGGTQWAGSIFEFNPDNSKYTVLAQFNHTTTGRYADAGLTYANGKLYGLVREGGKYGQGTIVEYDLTLKLFKKTFDFKSSINGGTPLGELTYLNGKLYGITGSGGNSNQGILFEYNPATGALVKLLDFGTDHPIGYVKEMTGILYGVSVFGGTTNSGSLFSFNPITRSYSKLIDFDTESNGVNPFGYLQPDGNKLWGMTMVGGKANGGVIFEYDLTHNQPTTRYSFNQFLEGKNPNCFVELKEKFYGLTTEGGNFNHGVLFEVDQALSGISVLHDFECNDCNVPYYQYANESKLLAIGNKLYGITAIGGNDEKGVLFEYDLQQNAYTVLHEFSDPITGIGPYGNLSIVKGKLYGTTKRGGSDNQGVLFEYNLATSVITSKQSLNYATTGVEHHFISVNDLLYGLSQGGGLGNGILSLYNPEDNTLVTKHEFQTRVIGELAYRSNKIYGVTAGEYVKPNTSQVSVYVPGIIFEFNIQTQQFGTVYNFNRNQSSDGVLTIHAEKLYSVESNGSSLFKFDLVDSPGHITNISFLLDYDHYIKSILVVDGNIESPLPIIANEVVAFNQGKRKDGKSITADRSNPEAALYYSDSNDDHLGPINFVSLGFGGSITLGFDRPLCNRTGNDLQIFEISYGNPSFYDYPEQAEVFVSEDASTWITLGLTNPSDPEIGCKAKLDSDFDIQSSGLGCIKYIRLVDVSDPWAKRRDKNTCEQTSAFAFNNAADGFDLDAIGVTQRDDQNGSSSRMAQRERSGIINIQSTRTTAVLFPNPVSRELVIDLSEEEEMAIMSDQLVFEIIDLQGRVLTKSSDALDDSWTIKHDVSQLKNGFYVARVSTGNVRRNYKFIKN